MLSFSYFVCVLNQHCHDDAIDCQAACNLVISEIMDYKMQFSFNYFDEMLKILVAGRHLQFHKVLPSYYRKESLMDI